MKRIQNFNAGPSTLPLEVLQTAQQELLDYKGTGMSVMEISHRTKEYDEINDGAMALVHELFGLGDNYKVLFMQGGAFSQFSLVPMNLLSPGKTAAYVDTGVWADKAIKEAKKIGNINVIASSKADKYAYIPKVADIKTPQDAAYLHVTSNNTIFGTQYDQFPDPGSVPMVCDMSSDIASRRRDFTKFALIYAGAQKNLGPAGVTLVIIREDLLPRSPESLGTMFNYNTHAAEKSLFNTPPVFSIYMMRLVMLWIKNQGGLEAIEKVNRAKKDTIYNLMDTYPDYFKGTVQKDSRSWMNLTLRLPSEDLETKFLSEAKASGFIGLKGHRSVGGIRVSLYNAMTLEGTQQLAGFMEEFRKKNS